METSFPLLFAAVVGFGHAFEADHLVAVSSIVTKRGKATLAVKDGIYWGLGHSSTILAIGLLMIVGKATFLNHYFGYFEAGVGLMLIILGVFRLYQYFQAGEATIDEHDNHKLAYGVGLIHGLAGSGAMVLLVMTEIESSFNSLVYLAIFGIGSALGMLTAAGIFSLPFTQKISHSRSLQFGLILLSSLLCIGYGTYTLIENLF
ncbi:MAG: urease accessory protein [Bacteroidota bacterium]